MVTRWRSFRVHGVTKVIAFLLMMAAIAAVFVSMKMILLKGANPECLIVPDYHKSEAFYEQIDDALEKVAMISFNYPSDLGDVPFYYYFKCGGIEYSNTIQSDRAFYEKYDRAFFYLDNGHWRAGENSYHRSDFGNTTSPAYTAAYVAFPDEYLDARQQIWDQDRILLVPLSIVIIASCVVAAVLLLYLVAVTGRVPQDINVHLSRIDHDFTELQLAVLVIGAGLFSVVMRGMLEGQFLSGLNMNYMLILIGTLSAAAGALIVFTLLSLIRKIKAGLIIKNSLLYLLISRTVRSVRKLVNFFFFGNLFRNATFTRDLYYRQLIFLATTLVMVSLAVLFTIMQKWWMILPLAVELFIIVWYIAGNKHLYDSIEDYVKEKMEEQLRAEKMKVALITNVSHDLKTPLTSIISFIDLLSKENGLSETAVDYISILQNKSERLKSIVTDLFDLAKSTSGDAVLEMEYIDLVKLVEQTLADMDDRISASGFAFKLILPDSPVTIYADGKKLYRVFQNVIDNALKYSQPGTRIHIELKIQGDRAVTIIRNIAGYDMNFTAQEILQRFTRGDASRSTEGSGLGLSIAESFTKVNGGDLRIEIDGDMFKVLIGFYTEQGSARNAVSEAAASGTASAESLRQEEAAAGREEAAVSAADAKPEQVLQNEGYAIELIAENDTNPEPLLSHSPLTGDQQGD